MSMLLPCPRLQVPTFRANPLHPACDEWCDFPVADRPNAVRQWIEAVEQGDEPLGGAWVLMLECDYVMFKPIPVGAQLSCCCCCCQGAGDAWGWACRVVPLQPCVQQVSKRTCKRS